MAKVVTDDKHYKDIADAIRNNPVTAPGKMKPEDMAKEAENAINGMYSFGYGEGENAGYNEGFQEGYDDGFYGGEESGRAAGEQLEYDHFWDAFQQNGTRRNYQYGFSGRGWNDNTFKPKYDIIINNDPMRMFVNCEITNLRELLEKQGVSLDTSAVTTAQYMFDSCTLLTEVPHIVCNASAAGLFSWCIALKTVSIEVNENTVFSSTFHRCDALENLTVVGTIGQSGLTLQYSTKLSKASITSVVNALSATASGKSITFSKTAVNNAFATDEWSALAGTKTNWTINWV